MNPPRPTNAAAAPMATLRALPISRRRASIIRQRGSVSEPRTQNKWMSTTSRTLNAVQYAFHQRRGLHDHAGDHEHELQNDDDPAQGRQLREVHERRLDRRGVVDAGDLHVSL